MTAIRRVVLAANPGGRARTPAKVRVSIVEASSDADPNALNAALIRTKFEYVAFVAAGEAVAHTLEEAERVVRQEPSAEFWCAHDQVRVVRRSAFAKVGLFDDAADGAQLHDLGLRLAEKCAPGDELSWPLADQFVPDPAAAAESTRRATRTNALRADPRSPLVSFVILSFNRVRDLERTLDTIDRVVRVDHEVVILDNASNEETRRYLRSVEARPAYRVLYEEKNLGCPGGRRRAIPLARGPYICTLDNDMQIAPRWVEDMILALDRDEAIGAVVSRVQFPSGVLEFAGGRMHATDESVRFELVHRGRAAEDLATLEPIECDWVPGGATLFRAAACADAEHCDEYLNAFEDNDYSLQLKAKGWRLVNCPTALATHHHHSTLGRADRRRESDYLSARVDPHKVAASAAVFERRWGLAIDDPAVTSYRPPRSG